MKISHNNIVQSCTYILIAILILTICLVAGCENQKPIKIGFVGGLTGRHYEFGISGRNGAMLAVEEANKKGGIAGRHIELIIRDDKQDIEAAVNADKELIEQGVIAIIGHMTSEMSIAALPIINEKKTVMISPTSSTALLEGKNDYFFKLTTNLKMATEELAEYAFKNMNLKKITAVYDLSNKTFSNEWLFSFKSKFESFNGKLISAVPFTSGADSSYSLLVKKLISNHPDGILIIANSLDTATLTQQTRKINPNIPILSSAWGMTADILKHGGKAVEGVVFSHIFNLDYDSSEFKGFKANYLERFGREPDFAAVKSYEATNIILSSIQNSKDMADFKKTILKKKKFKGLQGDFEIDKNGDVQQRPFIIMIRGNSFVTIK